ncbi:hypothetical protein C0Q70_07413 [Pomacea canaliculata]|uniref:CCHC-type domain-containing protein n=1 Tax=Pomacea canaliculata TaxID=400727 RepID=A0A2T7PEZ4_POMCA|nr:hypothetical protein C0Q70_07413 [Pomacea canaliculata]
MEFPDIDSFIAQGLKMGYTDSALEKYVQQCIERFDRYKERERERQERERQEREREIERERERERQERERQERERQERERQEREIEREFELEKLRLQAGRRTEGEEIQAAGGTRGGNLPKIPIFREDKDDIDSFIYRFEAHAVALRWEEKRRPLHLSALLQGEALTLYHALCARGIVDYETLKRELLQKYQCTAEGFRERFRSVRPEPHESMAAFFSRLSGLANRWITLAEADKTYEGLLDLMFQEQILQSVSKELAVFLQERDFKSATEMIASAEKYRQAHANKSMARRTELYRVANTGVNWRPRSPKFRLPNRPTSPRKSSPNKTYPNGSSGPRKQGDEVLRRTKRELTCFACNEIGHFARECPYVRWRDNTEVSTPVVTSVSILCSTLNSEEMDRLPLYPVSLKLKRTEAYCVLSYCNISAVQHEGEVPLIEEVEIGGHVVQTGRDDVDD